MKNHQLIICVVLAMFAITSSTPVSARWLEGGNAVCDTTGHQAEAYVIVADDGNWIVVWRGQTGSQYDIFANKIDLDGNLLWGPKGVLVCNQSLGQHRAKAVSDGAGGAIVVWEDQSGGYNIYAQRVDTDGVALWPLIGVPICLASSMQSDPVIISDDNGGAIITWYDRRNLNYDVYAQRVDGTGTVLWTTDGVPVSVQPDNQVGTRLVPDGNSGAILAWTDRRNGTNSNVYAQRIDSNGNPQWTVDGIPLEPSPDEQGSLDLIDDGTGGAIVVWENRSALYYTQHATRISADSTLVWGGAVELYAAGGDQKYCVVTTDGNGGAIAIWEDWTYGSGNIDLRAQRVDFLGNVMWPGGVVISTAPGPQYEPQICPDGFGGAMFTWDDERQVKGDIYAQRVDASGVALWTADGAVVSQMTNDQAAPTIAPDGEAGAILAYQDYRDGLYYKAYAQRIERNGYWGYPAPYITGVRDIPGDQGGYVNLSWDASRLDPWPDMLISSYTVWRAISPVAALALQNAGARFEDTIRLQETGGQTHYWYLIDTVDPYHLPGYSVPAPTLFDSTATSDELHYFQVIAHTSDPQTFWVSEPDSGYSVDNIGPAVPASLAGEQIQIPTGLRLTWDPNSEPDLGGYNIYRGLGGDFVPGPGNLISTLPDTCYLDEEWLWDSGFVYKVAAIDIHDNESDYALLLPDNVTGAEADDTPNITFLGQNYPNPFNPVTTIRFGLKTTGQVSLRIYNASGALVRVLVDEEREAKFYDETWDGRDKHGGPVASGIYFYRLETGEFTTTRKMLLLK